MKKKIFIVCLVCAISSCNYLQSKFSVTPAVSAVTEEKEYVLGSDDIPLFPGLQLMEDDSSSFDSPVGSIVISKYLGDFRLRSVKSFYLEALPQLGWKLVSNESEIISFIREDDKLEIRLNYASKGLYVRFFISSVTQ
jgi:hypothetical protein